MKTELTSFMVPLLIAATLSSLPAAEFTEEELAYMPAILLIELFERGDISPVDVLKAQRERVDRYEDRINAITVEHWDAALKLAKASEQRYKDGSYGHLEGITVGVGCN